MSTHNLIAKLFCLLSLLTGVVTISYAQLLNELLVNPNGADENCEYVELKGTGGMSLNNIHFLSIEGDNTSNPGVIDLVVDLSGEFLGSNGLLVMTPSSPGMACGSRNYYSPPTTRVLVSDMNGGGLETGANSWLLVSSTVPITQGMDYDVDNDGVLELLPGSAVILDAVGWQANGDISDIVYGSVLLPAIVGNTPDAAVRFPENNAANSIPAWYYGDMSGLVNSLEFDITEVSANFPVDGILTPGQHNVDIDVIFENGFETGALIRIGKLNQLEIVFIYDVLFELSYSSQRLWALIEDSGQLACIELRRINEGVLAYRFCHGAERGGAQEWKTVSEDRFLRAH